MKLATFLRAGGTDTPRIGVLADDGQSLIDLAAVAAACDPMGPAAPATMLEFLRRGAVGRDQMRKWVDACQTERPDGCLVAPSAVQWLAPIPVPTSIRDCMNFQQHGVQSMRTAVRWRFPWVARFDSMARRVTGRALVRVPSVWRQQPVYYKGNPRSVVGHEADVLWPTYTKRLDFELEFGFYIGKTGCDIEVRQAHEHVGGYTLFNDFSARDVQLLEMQGHLGPAKGKDFDTGNVMGPYLVTPDEVPDPDTLEMTVAVNGQIWSRTSSRNMQFSVAELIAYLSRHETLYVGDFIGVGTLPDGCGMELDRWIQVGDQIELTSDVLGTLRNQIVAAEKLDSPEFASAR